MYVHAHTLYTYLTIWHLLQCKKCYSVCVFQGCHNIRFSLTDWQLMLLSVKFICISLAFFFLFFIFLFLKGQGVRACNNTSEVDIWKQHISLDNECTVDLTCLFPKRKRFLHTFHGHPLSLQFNFQMPKSRPLLRSCFCESSNDKHCFFFIIFKLLEIKYVSFSTKTLRGPVYSKCLAVGCDAWYSWQCGCCSDNYNCLNLDLIPHNPFIISYHTYLASWSFISLFKAPSWHICFLTVRKWVLINSFCMIHLPAS